MRGVPLLHIEIGPLREAPTRHLDATICVSDYWSPSLLKLPNYHWIPVNEISRSWGYLPFFTFKCIMDSLSECPSIYICCSAGEHRSPMMVLSWLMAKGLGVDAAEKQFVGFENLADQYRSDQRDGFIPCNLDVFYKEMETRTTYREILMAMGEYENISYQSSWDDPAPENI